MSLADSGGNAIHETDEAAKDISTPASVSLTDPDKSLACETAAKLSENAETVLSAEIEKLDVSPKTLRLNK